MSEKIKHYYKISIWIFLNSASGQTNDEDHANAILDKCPSVPFSIDF